MYIVPPKLQNKLLIGRLTVPEALITLALAILFVVLGMFSRLFIPAAYGILSWRFVGDRNAIFYFKMLYNYYQKPQHFTRRLSHE